AGLLPAEDGAKLSAEVQGTRRSLPKTPADDVPRTIQAVVDRCLKLSAADADAALADAERLYRRLGDQPCRAEATFMRGMFRLASGKNAPAPSAQDFLERRLQISDALGFDADHLATQLALTATLPLTEVPARLRVWRNALKWFDMPGPNL